MYFKDTQLCSVVLKSAKIALKIMLSMCCLAINTLFFFKDNGFCFLSYFKRVQGEVE